MKIIRSLKDKLCVNCMETCAKICTNVTQNNKFFYLINNL